MSEIHRRVKSVTVYEDGEEVTYHFRRDRSLTVLIDAEGER